MKKYVLIIILMSSVHLFSQFSGGAGTENNPYQIRTLQELENVSLYSDRCFILMNNIDDSLRKPLCGSINYFTGIFNGNGYKISLAIIAEEEDSLMYREPYHPNVPINYYGLFSFVSQNYSMEIEIPTIKNVIVDGYIVNKDTNILAAIGGIAGCTYLTKIYNCVNLANITNIYGMASGIVSDSETYNKPDNISIHTVKNCINLGNIISPISGSGIVSFAEEISIFYCVNAGFINGFSHFLYGILCDVFHQAYQRYCISTGVFYISEP